MELLGKIWKDGKFWLVDIPVIDVSTQGRTRKEALMMIEDAILELLKSYFPNDVKNFHLDVVEHTKTEIGIKASQSNIMLSFSLIRQREMSKSTVRDVAKRLGSKSPNAYAQYERGRMRMTLDQYERLLGAVNPDRPASLLIA
jgi:predicted RNase H-like HicB family nuclease